MRILLNIAQVVNWIVVAVVGFFVFAGLTGIGEGGGALAGLATVLALTAILWGPVALIFAFISFSARARAIRETKAPIALLLKEPSTYVLAFTLYVLSLMVF